MTANSTQPHALHGQLQSLLTGNSQYARFTSEAENFLSQLNSLMLEQHDDAVGLLQQKNEEGFNLGQRLARHCTNPAVLNTYLTLVKDLMATDFPAAITLLQQQTMNGWNIGHCLVNYRNDPAVLHTYLTLVQDLMAKDVPAAITLLQQQEEYGWNIGYLIASLQPAEMVNHYLDLLSEATPRAPAAIFSLLTAKLVSGVELSNNLTDKLLELYHTILLNAFVALFNSDNEVSASIKIADYIGHSVKITELLKALPANEQTLTLLQQCLDNTTPIGKYCHTSTGHGITAAYRGETTMVKNLSAKLKEVIAEIAKQSPPRDRALNTRTLPWVSRLLLELTIALPKRKNSQQ